MLKLKTDKNINIIKFIIIYIIIIKKIVILIVKKQLNLKKSDNEELEMSLTLPYQLLKDQGYLSNAEIVDNHNLNLELDQTFDRNKRMV